MIRTINSLKYVREILVIMRRVIMEEFYLRNYWKRKNNKHFRLYENFLYKSFANYNKIMFYKNAKNSSSYRTHVLNLSIFLTLALVLFVA